MTSSGSEATPHDPGQAAAAGGAPVHSGVDLGRLRLADWAVALGTLLYLVFMVLPWYSIDGFDLGSGYRIPGVSVNGFDSGTLTVAFVLLLLASVWALLPAFVDVAVPFPRSFLTAGLAALAFVLTLVEWLSTFDAGFTFFGLLTFLASAAVLAFAVLRLLPELGGSAPVPGRLAGATQWANGPTPQFGRGEQHPAPPPAPPTSTGEPGDRPPGA